MGRLLNLYTLARAKVVLAVDLVKAIKAQKSWSVTKRIFLSPKFVNEDIGAVIPTLKT